MNSTCKIKLATVLITSLLAASLGCGKDKSEAKEKAAALDDGFDERDAGASSASAATNASGQPLILPALRKIKTFATLLTLLEQTKLDQILKGKGPFILVAPSDEAFDKLSPAALDALLTDEALLTSTLKHHVAAGKIDLAGIAALGEEGKTLAGSDGVDLQFATDSISVTIDGSRVVGQVEVGNGSIIFVDTVLQPAAAPAAVGGKVVKGTTAPMAAAKGEPSLTFTGNFWLGDGTFDDIYGKKGDPQCLAGLGISESGKPLGREQVFPFKIVGGQASVRFRFKKACGGYESSRYYSPSLELRNEDGAVISELGRMKLGSQQEIIVAVEKNAEEPLSEGLYQIAIVTPNTDGSSYVTQSGPLQDTAFQDLTIDVTLGPGGLETVE